MAQKKGSHLNSLMKELGVSGNMLADYLNVDGSLVSKWRSTRRKISADYLDKIVKLFLSLDEGAHYQTIIRVSGFSSDAAYTSEQVRDYLRLWLTSASDQAKDSLDAMISSQARAFSGYIFSGESGKREAVSIFLDYSAQSGGQKIWLYSQQGADWLLKDAGYRFEWQNKNFAVLKNNEVRVIHPVYKDYRHVAEYLLRWLPLHMYGDALAYYIPRYQIPSSEYTLCLTENTVAMLSFTSAENPKRVTTFLFSDEEGVQCVKDLVLSLFEGARPLFQRYSYADSAKYRDAYQRFSQGNGNGICFTAGPPLFLLRRDLLHACVQTLGYSKEEIDNFSAVTEVISLENTIRHGMAPVTIVLHLEQLRKLLRYRNPNLRTVSYCMGRSFPLQQEQFRQCLRAFLDVAEEHREIQVILAERSIFSPYDDIDMFVREREIAGFVGSMYHTDHITRALTITEGAVVSALYHNMDFYAQTHPSRAENLQAVRDQIEDLFRQYPPDSWMDPEPNNL